MPRAPKHCGHNGCTELVQGDRYCPPHKAIRQARESNTKRGYTHAHHRTRQALLPHAAGTLCPLCNEPMLDGQPLHADHSTPLAVDRMSVADRITHAWCNESAAASARSAKPPASTPSPP